MNHDELKVEDVLDDDELVNDIKTNPNSQLAPFFSSEVVKKMIDYATKIPSADELKLGHKYPFNACEILCSENTFIVEKLLEFTKEEEENTTGNDEQKPRKESQISENYVDDHSADSEDSIEDKMHNLNIKENQKRTKRRNSRNNERAENRRRKRNRNKTRKRTRK